MSKHFSHCISTMQGSKVSFDLPRTIVDSLNWAFEEKGFTRIQYEPISCKNGNKFEWKQTKKEEHGTTSALRLRRAFYRGCNDLSLRCQFLTNNEENCGVNVTLAASNFSYIKRTHRSGLILRFFMVQYRVLVASVYF